MKFSWLVAVFFLAQSVPAWANFGSIAFSQSTGSWGTAYNYADQFSAQASAIGRCGVADCEAVAWVQNGCAALAVGEGNAYGWSWNTDRGIAEYSAIQECSQRTGSCSVLAWVCSG